MGVTGATGPAGPTGATGETGAAGEGAIIAYSSGLPVSMTTVLGGACEFIQLGGFWE